MPLFSEHINNMYYSGSPSYSASPYSSYSAPIGSSYSASYLNPGGNYSKHSSLGGYSRPQLTSRWSPASGRNYSPLLTTISERSTSSPLRIHSPRRIPYSQRSYATSSYIPKPIHINTADIDVSRDKYQVKPPEQATYTPAYPHVPAAAVPAECPLPPPQSETTSDEDKNPFMPRVDGKPDTGIDSTPGPQRSTIRRGRTVVRLHTIKRKDKDSPRKAEESNITQLAQETQNDLDLNLGWREKLSEDLVYKDKREKKTLGAKLVEKFIVKDKNDDDLEKTKRNSPKKVDELDVNVEPQQSIEASVSSKSPDRRCSMELLAEQATLLDYLIRGENLSLATLDLTKVGVTEETQNNNQGQDANSNFQRNSLKTTKSDHSLHDRISSYKDSRDKHYSKRRSLKKSASGGSLRRLDSITEFPKESLQNSNLPAIEESRNSIKNEAPPPKLKKKPIITASVEVMPPTSPIKFRVDEVTIEEKPLTPKKGILYSSVIDETVGKRKSIKKSQPNYDNITSRLSVRRQGRDMEIDAPSPEPDDGNFWNKLGKRETVYLLKRKQNIADEMEKNRRAMFWFPEDEILENNTENETPIAVVRRQEITQIEELAQSSVQPVKIEQVNSTLEVRVAVPMNNTEMKERPVIIHDKSIDDEKTESLDKVNSEEKTVKLEPVVSKSDHNADVDKITAGNMIVSTAIGKKTEIVTNFAPNSTHVKIEIKSVSETPLQATSTAINSQIEAEVTKTNDSTEPSKIPTDTKIEENQSETKIETNPKTSETLLPNKIPTPKVEKIEEAQKVNTSLKKVPPAKKLKSKNKSPKSAEVQQKNELKNTAPEVDTGQNKIKSAPPENKAALPVVKAATPMVEPAAEVKPIEHEVKPVEKTQVEQTQITDVVPEVPIEISVSEKKPTIIEIPKIETKLDENIPDKVVEHAQEVLKTEEDIKADSIPGLDAQVIEEVKEPLPESPKIPVPVKKPIKQEAALRPLIATPRPLQKKAPQIIHSSSSSTSSSEEESSEEDESNESSASEESTEFYECENNTDGRTSTGSNDSGFDSSAPTSPAGFVHIKKDCDVNCHRKCEKLTANLCGVNQRLLVEALASRTASKRGGEATPAASSSQAQPTSAPEVSEQELESSTAYGIFRKTGRFTPPAKSIPRFRKYNIEDFHFIKVLGKGSFGKVLLTELRDTEYYYAVKCLKKDVVLEDDDVECTLIERKVLALGTNHPYLCHLFATFQTDSHLFFVMEYLNGGDLMFHIQQSGRFPEARSRFYAAEIVSGLKFLHKRGIVYRDLKLDNILLDYEGHVRIADFGMCKLQIFLDKTADTFCGTPDYMAPEIIKGQKYNQTVDWWSFGVLLYEMLIGQSPFSGCDEDELFWSICNEMPSYPRFLSQEALTILTRLLDKDARTRLGGTECMHGDVRDQEFFRSIHWDRLDRRELETPFKPRVRHPLDTQYFDRAFTGERPRLTAVEPQVLRSMDQAPFRGFSYTNPNATDR